MLLYNTRAVSMCTVVTTPKTNIYIHLRTKLLLGYACKRKAYY